MKVGVVGAGAIGRFVGISLRLVGTDTVFRVRRPDELGSGIFVVDRWPKRLRGFAWPPDGAPIGSLADCDVVLCCVKSAATREAAATIAAETNERCLVVSLQNGIRNATTLRAALPGHTVLAGIVGFNVVRADDDSMVRQTTSGALSIEANDRATELVAALRTAGLDVATPRDIERHQYTKLLVNLGNAVSALSEAPTRELMLSRAFRRILATLIGEALGVLRAARIRPARLRGIPVRIVPMMMRLPTPIVRLVARAQLKIDPAARSSMWDDLTRGRTTEVDELNGEIVRLAEAAGIDAPANRRIVELVHAAERAAAGSPKLTAAALAEALA